MPDTRQRTRRRRWVGRAVPAGVVVALVAAGTVVAQANTGPVESYRTTTVSTGSLQQRLNVTGSVQRVDQVGEEFSVTGTVASLSVSVGDTVKQGQILATLDPAPLRSAVTAAKAALAKAKATLESDQSAATATTDTAGTATATTSQVESRAQSTSPKASSGSNPSSPSSSGTSQSVARAQDRVSAAQKAVATDLERSAAALAQCRPFFPSESGSTTTADKSPTPPTSDPSSTPNPTPTPTATGTPTTPATTGPSDATIKSCLAVLQAAPTQPQIQRDQQALTRSQADLTKAFTLAITTASAAAAATSPAGLTSQSSSTPSSSSPSSSSPSSSSQSSGAGTGAPAESSAARIVSDQAAVTEAEAALGSATANRAAATLKSSIAGTVGSTSLAKGLSSSGKTIEVVGAGAAEVTVNVPIASVGKVHVGQAVSVTPLGATTSVLGAVSSISLLPSTAAAASGTAPASAAESGPTYPVVVLVPDAHPALASGSRAEASVLIGTVANALLLPNSALTPLGNGRASALTFKAGVTTRTVIQTGYVGTLTTEITSGLTAGQQVVLADLGATLPTNTTNARRLGVGGAAGGGLGAGLGGGQVTGGAGPPPLG